MSVAPFAVLAGILFLAAAFMGSGKAVGGRETRRLAPGLRLASALVGTALVGAPFALHAVRRPAEAPVPPAVEMGVQELAPPDSLQDARDLGVQTVYPDSASAAGRHPGEPYFDPADPAGSDSVYDPPPEWAGLFGRSELTWTAGHTPMRAVVDMNGRIGTAVITWTDARGGRRTMKEELEIGGGYGDEELYFQGINPRDPATAVPDPDSAAVSFFMRRTARDEPRLSHAGNFDGPRYRVTVEPRPPARH